MLGGYDGQPHAQQEHTDAARQHDVAKPNVRPPRSYVYDRLVAADDYESPCYDSIDGPKSDLCQQWRMAEAAEKQAWWTYLQTVLAGLAFIGLIATVIYTHFTLRLAGKTGQAQLRAYVSMNPQILGGLFEGGVVRIQFFPKNHGQTPATDFWHEIGMGIMPPVLPEEFTYPTSFIMRSKTTIYPDSDERVWFDAGSVLTKENVKSISDGLHFWCWGRTHYKDVFGIHRHVDFRVSVSGPDVVEAQRLHKVGIKELPEWGWSFGNGHNRGN